MPLTLPFQITSGTLADATQVQANFNALAGKFSAAIVDADISPSAAINGTKISTSPGSRLPTAGLEDAAITAAKLAFDNNPGAPLAAINNPNQIKDGTITSAKILAASLLNGSAKLTTYVSATLNTFLGVATLNNVGSAGSWNFASTGLIKPGAANGVIPLAVWIESATGAALDGTDTGLELSLMTTTQDNFIYVAVRNFSNNASRALSNYTIKIVYWSAT